MALTTIVLAVVVAFLLVYEFAVIVLKRPRSTISEAVWGLCGRYPYLAFFVGVLCGHFFWQSPETYQAYANVTSFIVGGTR